MTRLEKLHTTLQATFGDTVSLKVALGEITIEVSTKDWLDVCAALRDNEALHFETCIDLCGMDYSAWGAPTNTVEPGLFPARFAVVLHLLSLKHNVRIRVRTFVPGDDFPVLPSLVDVWPSVNWYEREAFDLYGIVFEGHPDLRRILTDYGFIGHPFRKDFPISGYVEMRYDTEQQRVIYQPVSIEPREVTPRVVREEGYGVER